MMDQNKLNRDANYKTFNNEMFQNLPVLWHALAGGPIFALYPEAQHFPSRTLPGATSDC